MVVGGGMVKAIFRDLGSLQTGGERAMQYTMEARSQEMLLFGFLSAQLI